MGLDIVRGVIKNAYATEELIQTINEISSIKEFNGTMFIGYPLIATNESKITVDALLITKEKGLVAFVFHNPEIDEKEEQDLLYFQITNTLTNYESLRVRKGLAFEPSIITYYPQAKLPQSEEGYIYSNKSTLRNNISTIPGFQDKYYERLCEALQRIASMKSNKKRRNVRTENSKGYKMKKIESAVANLDEWQKKAAYEVPEGPQRIRGLAGSGKTVVLALKAAYLHSQHQDWDIAVTFYSRSLAQQFKDMIDNFASEFINEGPDWEKLHILHAWGTNLEDGVYSVVSKKRGMVPLTYNNAVSKYGRNSAFSGICNEVLIDLGEDDLPIYDAILIDEAQDMPENFFKLCYKIIKKPKRIVFAYDELQNLNNNTMPTLGEMFGKDKYGSPTVNLTNEENEARRDIVLPICYRNTPWALTIAHCLGFGIYREGGLVQLFSELDLWDDIGYEVIDGTLQHGEEVSLSRKESSSPQYFKELITDTDAVIVGNFNSKEEQYQWIAEEIEKNITVDELDPDDILVIFPDVYYAKSDYTEFRKYLMRKNIGSILAGVDTDRDIFRIKNCITCSQIYRAKGNESPVVYVVNADYCAQGAEMITLRNTLFTAITRSRAWVRICGVAPNMDIIQNEINKCIENSYALKFNVPTNKELEQLRLIHRDRSENEKKKIKNASAMLKTLMELVEKGDIDANAVPELNAFMNTIQKHQKVDGLDEDK